MKTSVLQMNEIQPKIKVVGIGCGGINAVNQMISYGTQGVEFLAVDCDEKALLLSKAKNRIQIGEGQTKRLGFIPYPEFGRKVAEESRDKLIEQLRDADMVFITAGMGGSMGTGAAPIVAKYAQEAGALTVGVVTKAFIFEGKSRRNLSEDGVRNLQEYVDTLCIIPCDFLMDKIDQKATLKDAYRFTDDMMRHEIQGISDLIVCSGLVNADYKEVKTMLSHGEVAQVGFGIAKGKYGAVAAAEAAIKSRLLTVDIEEVQDVLFNFTCGDRMALSEVVGVSKTIAKTVNAGAKIIYGGIIDKKLAQDEYQVTVYCLNCSDLPKKKEFPDKERIMKQGLSDYKWGWGIVEYNYTSEIN